MTITIGVFDSGIGGLTVVREIKRLMPEYPLIYFGDTARTPYGTKSKETLIQYAEEDTRFLLDQGADLIVIACHSAASTATRYLKEKFSVPIFEVVTPSVNQAIQVTRNGIIGLIGTRATVESRIYESLIQARHPDMKVIGQPCPLLVPLVEEGWLKARETRMIVKKYLRPLKTRQVDTLVLGCTHYPILKGVIQEKIGKRVTIVDPSEAVAEAIYDYIQKIDEDKTALQDNADRFFLSDIGPATLDIVKRFMGRQIELEKVSLCCH